MSLLEMDRKKGKYSMIHLIGIGGIGMSGIAEIMHNLGYYVQGSDLLSNYATEKLAALGIKIFQGHNQTNLQGVAYVVVSSAIKNDNEELIAAKELNIPIISRAEMLAELMRLKCSIAVSGSHGKTTTTSLISCLFEAAGLDPTCINGGVINSREANAYLGASEYLIAEADESDATFIKIPATIAVITNIDPEHMDFYQNFDQLKMAFRNFILNLPFYGFAVVCLDHPIVRQITKSIKARRIITYGIEAEEAEIRAVNIRFERYFSYFDVIIRPKNSEKLEQKTIKDIKLSIPGKHNILNALAAIAISIEFNFSKKIIKDGLINFQGVKRRFSLIGQYNGAEIIDDYAHHPIEIESVLTTASQIAKEQGGRVIAVFQPHKYSRLKYLFDEFAQAFTKADKVLLMDVFAAGEAEIGGINSSILAKSMQQYHNEVQYVANDQELVSELAKLAKPGDMIMMMGAGDITYLAQALPRILSKSLLNNQKNSNIA